VFGKKKADQSKENLKKAAEDWNKKSQAQKKAERAWSNNNKKKGK
jgi:hypothetical protein